MCFDAIREYQIFLVAFDSEKTYITKWCYAKGVYKSCESSNQIFFNVFIFESKRQIGNHKILQDKTI